MLSVSSAYTSEGETHAIMSALDEPPNESINNIVSLESLYGICLPAIPRLSDNQDITFPNVKSDLFIFPVSFIISPFDSVSFKRSEPAKSTNEILPYFL